jgi:hypothetical protein
MYSSYQMIGCHYNNKHNPFLKSLPFPGLIVYIHLFCIHMCVCVCVRACVCV